MIWYQKQDERITIMTIRNFQIFVEVCNRGSMSAAAKEYHISQSAVSQIIKEMEEHYHTTLFRREAHRLYLTETGKKLYSMALKMIQYSSSIETAMYDTSKTATLRIGSVSAEIMVDLIAEYRESHPELSFSLINGTRPLLEQMLTSAQLDIAIVGGIFQLSGYRQFPLSSIDNLLACNIDSQISELLSPEQPVLSPEELSRFPIYICSISEDIEQYLHSFFQSRRVPYNIAGSFLHYNGVIEAAIKDLGIILVNRTNFENASGFLKEIRVNGFQCRSHLSLICSEDRAEEPILRDLITFAQKNFDSLRRNYPTYRNL